MTLQELQNEVFHICGRYGYDHETEVIELYNDAVEAYEMTEEPIITDHDFDILKKYLIDSGKIEFKAGVEKLGVEKIPHFYPMLSIETVKHSEIGSSEKLIEFLSKKHDGLPQNGYSISWKLDGIALQAVYENGHLLYVLTRGERTAGVDVTHNMRHAFPEFVPVHVRAIIGEGVISKDNFEQHLSHRYKNERNACSGIITSKGEKRANLRPYIEFVAFKVVTENKDVICPYHVKGLFDGIELPENFHINEQNLMMVESIFKYIQDKEEVRPMYKFRTDGIIIRNDYADRDEVKNGLYHAYTAYKYDAVQAETTILDITFRTCNNGALFPMGVLDPVDVDGSTVSSVSLFNYANLVKQGLFTGAKIIIVKSGDIIPHVEHVLSPVYEAPEGFNEEHEIDMSTFDGVNVFTSADLTELKFIAGVEKLGLKNVGDALAKVLFDVGFTNIIDLFNLPENYELPDGMKMTKPIRSMLDQVYALFQNIPVKILIQSLRFHGIGDTSSTKMAELMTKLHGENLPIQDLLKNFHSLYMEDNPNVYERNFLESEVFTNLCNVIMSNTNRIAFNSFTTVISETAIKVVMTGSPKEFGYAKKADFITEMQNKGIEVIEVKKMADADYLITDDLNSTSSKMKDAEKKGVKIKTYGEF